MYNNYLFKIVFHQNTYESQYIDKFIFICTVTKGTYTPISCLAVFWAALRLCLSSLTPRPDDDTSPAISDGRIKASICSPAHVGLAAISSQFLQDADFRLVVGQEPGACLDHIVQVFRHHTLDPVPEEVLDPVSAQ